MPCPRCQHENPPGSNFCLGCGARLGLQCASCGNELPAGSRFCNKCGHAVTGAADSERSFASPDTYTPKHLAEKILTSKAALEGERKQVTVLFADLKGSMELLADRDPEEARKLLDPVLEQMMEAVHRYEGTVNQVMGDGIMALFGAPLAHEDHAVRACYAALDMQAAIRRYAEEVRRTQGVKVQVRVGLNSGEVVVRAVGSDLRMDYSAVGQTTHLAARMEQLADPGATLMTADTLRLAEGYVEVRPLGPVPVKGLDLPVEVYELVGAGALRSRLRVAAARGLTRFVGRERELEQLYGALGRAATGHGQAVAIVGEAGVGKSRLVWEVTHSHRVHGWLVLHAGSVSYGKATSYLPVIDLLKGYLEVQDRDDPGKVRERVVGKLLTLDESLKAALPAFLGLLDAPIDDPQWQALDPAQRRQRTLDAIRRLFFRESQRQPLLVIFEDLHWIDGETQALLDSCVESVPTARMLLLVNYRPEYGHRWGSKTYYTQLRLDALAPESAETLLDALLGGDVSLRPLKDLLVERTEGNPFFLEESVQTLVETRALVGTRGAYRLTKPIDRTEVPATVHAVLAARIDRLPPAEKQLLQAASVVGKDVPYPILSAIVDEPEDALRRGIAHLQETEFLYETSLFPDLEYTFKHALTHEVAYGSLLHERRRALHARIADAIEAIHKDRVAEHVERLAHHAYRGEAWDRALVYLRQAGAKAVGRGALQEAVTCLEQALAALDRLPSSPATLDVGIDLRLSLRNVLYALGEHERSFAHLEPAERLAVERGDPRRLARVLRYMSTHFMFVGDYAHAAEAGRRAVRTAESSDDADLKLETRLGLALIHVTRGDYTGGAAALGQIGSELADEGSPPRLFGIALMSVTAFGFLASACAELGEFERAGQVAAEALHRAERYEPRYSVAAGAWSVGYVSVRRGDLAEATRVLAPALEQCRATGLPLMLPALASMLGLAHSLSGRHAEGLPLLEEAVQLRARGWVHSSPLVCLAEGYLLAGHVPDAGRLARQALDLARARGERGMEARALWLLGEIIVRGDASADLGAATERYEQARTLANELGMRPLVAHCHLGLGTLYRRTGNRVKAQEHLASAATLYREMGMTFWLEKADAELGGVER